METRTIILNLQPRTTIQVMKVSQYDVGVPMSFIIYDGNNPASLTSGTTVTFQMTRPSGIAVSRAGSLSGNIVSLSTVLDMTRESGDVQAELRFVRGSEDVGVCNFTFSIEPAARADDAIDATTEALQVIADQVRADTIQSSTNVTNAKAAEDNARNYANTAKTNADIAVAAAKSAGQASTTAVDASATAVDAASRAEAAAEQLVMDESLTQQGKAADAKATGDAIRSLDSRVSTALEEGLAGLTTKEENDIAADRERLTFLESEVEKAVRYDKAQELTDEQKVQARANIGTVKVSLVGTGLVFSA